MIVDKGAVNSQSGGQSSKIANLHLKGLFLSGERITIVLSSRLGITEMGLFVIYFNLIPFCLCDNHFANI